MYVEKTNGSIKERPHLVAKRISIIIVVWSGICIGFVSNVLGYASAHLQRGGCRMQIVKQLSVHYIGYCVGSLRTWWKYTDAIQFGTTGHGHIDLYDIIYIDNSNGNKWPVHGKSIAGQLEQDQHVSAFDPVTKEEKNTNN
jgi:hypothetical protein